MTGFSMRAAEAAAAVGGRLVGGDAGFTGVSTDTRRIAQGDLFVAIRGERFDAHDFAADAARAGAAAVLVSRELPGLAIPQVVAPDSRVAFGKLAQAWRRRFTLPTLALTGSNGKTTVKEMLKAILAAHCGDAAAVLATEGNLNNDIGVPQMLLRLRSSHRYAVFELGMNHLGEIDYLTRLTEPDVAMVIMAGTAHIGELGSREAIAQAKGEIYGALKPGGIAVINMHDRFGAYWREIVQGHRVISFGIAPEDDVHATFRDGGLAIRHRGEQAEVALKVPGEHNQSNALAAAAGALALGVPLATIAAALAGFTGVAGRLRTFTGHNSATIIDDTYNANPDSVKAAIKVLAARPAPRVLVLGDMGELGEDGPAMHREVGEFARRTGIERLFALGTLTAGTVDTFGAGAARFDDPDGLTRELKPLLTPATTVLVKGSRFMKMERVVGQLVPGYDGGHH